MDNCEIKSAIQFVSILSSTSIIASLLDTANRKICRSRGTSARNRTAVIIALLRYRTGMKSKIGDYLCCDLLYVATCFMLQLRLELKVLDLKMK